MQHILHLEDSMLGNRDLNIYSEKELQVAADAGGWISFCWKLDGIDQNREEVTPSFFYRQ